MITLTYTCMDPIPAYAFIWIGVVLLVASLVLYICKHPKAGTLFLIVGSLLFIYGFTGGFTGHICELKS